MTETLNHPQETIENPALLNDQERERWEKYLEYGPTGEDDEATRNADVREYTDLRYPNGRNAEPDEVVPTSFKGYAQHKLNLDATARNAETRQTEEPEDKDLGTVNDALLDELANNSSKAETESDKNKSAADNSDDAKETIDNASGNGKHRATSTETNRPAARPKGRSSGKQKKAVAELAQTTNEDDLSTQPDQSAQPQGATTTSASQTTEGALKDWKTKSGWAANRDAINARNAATAEHARGGVLPGQTQAETAPAASASTQTVESASPVDKNVNTQTITEPTPDVETTYNGSHRIEDAIQDEPEETYTGRHRPETIEANNTVPEGVDVAEWEGLNPKIRDKWDELSDELKDTLLSVQRNRIANQEVDTTTADDTEQTDDVDNDTAQLPVNDPSPTGIKARWYATTAKATLKWHDLKERAGNYYGDEEDGKRRKITAGVIGGIALVGTATLGAYLATKGHSSGGSAHQQAAEHTNDVIAPAPSGAGAEALPRPPISLTLTGKGDTLWDQVSSYGQQHGVQLNEVQVHDISDKILTANGQTWESARSLPVGFTFNIDPSLMEEMLKAQ